MRKDRNFTLSIRNTPTMMN